MYIHKPLLTTRKSLLTASISPISISSDVCTDSFISSNHVLPAAGYCFFRFLRRYHEREEAIKYLSSRDKTRVRILSVVISYYQPLINLRKKRFLTTFIFLTFSFYYL